MRKIPFEKVDLNLYEHVTPDGLKVLIAPIKDAVKTVCGIYVDYGAFKHEHSVGKTSIPYGVAHFLEHRLFDTPQGNASALMEKMGAYANAMTSYSYTLYYFETTNDIYKPLDLLLAMTTNLTFDEASVEKEKPIILSELAMYENEPLEVINQALKDNLYFESPLRQDILGTRDSIKEIHQSTLRKIFNCNYGPERLTLICTGRVDPVEIEAHLAKLKFVGGRKKEEVKPLTYRERYNEVKREISRQTFPLENTKVAVGIKFLPREELYTRYGDKLFAIYTLLPELLFGAASKETERLIEQRLALSVEDYSLIEGGEDACLSAVFMTDDEEALIAELKSYFSALGQKFCPRDLSAVRKDYIGRSTRRIGSPNALFDDLVASYANHIASPAMIENVKIVSSHDFKKFLKDMSTWPIAFAVLTKENSDAGH